MMSNEREISVNGTELDFLNAVYDFFLKFDGVITTPSKANLEEEFNSFDGTDNYFSFTITYKDITIIFKRETTGLTAARSYLVTINNTSLTDIQCTFKSSYVNPTITTTREWNLLGLVVTPKSLLFKLQQSNGATQFRHLFLVVSINRVSSVLYTSSTVSPPIGTLSSLNFQLAGENNSIFKIAEMLPYVASEEGEDRVDYFQFSVLCNDILQKISLLDGLNHCSTVPVDKLLTIDGTDYYSIASDTIVAVEEE